MYGLEAISASNGWAISVVGITIVFTGLVLLSTVISQLYKVVELFDHPERIKAWFSRPEPELSPAAPVLILTGEQKETAKQFGLLVRTMDDHFSLPRLLRLAQVSGVKHPHGSLNLLLKSEIIIPDGDGYFTWDSEQFSLTVAD